MKKALLSIFTVLTMVCIFALSASAYEHKYFSIDVPSDYEVTEESDGVQFDKSEEVLITINLSENNYTDFYNMSSAERSQWDQNMKSAYSSIGTITEFESEQERHTMLISGFIKNYNSRIIRIEIACNVSIKYFSIVKNEIFFSI